jgi:NAD(P)-dependent dehydrogenase (short-subunit alcohol dehydrogenase family)
VNRRRHGVGRRRHHGRVRRPDANESLVALFAHQGAISAFEAGRRIARRSPDRQPQLGDAAAPEPSLNSDYLEKKGGQLGGNASGYLLNGPRWERYHQTKLANAVFTLALKDRLAESGIKAVCAAPGAAATNLQITSLDSGAMSEMGLRIGKYMSQSAKDGAMPILRACFDPETNNGDFYEPSQYMAMRGPAVKVEYDKLSADPDARAVLWEKSEEACGTFEI